MRPSRFFIPLFGTQNRCKKKINTIKALEMWEFSGIGFVRNLAHCSWITSKELPNGIYISSLSRKRESPLSLVHTIHVHSLSCSPSQIWFILSELRDVTLPIRLKPTCCKESERRKMERNIKIFTWNDFWHQQCFSGNVCLWNARCYACRLLCLFS